jgi:hypothetical protein
MRRWFSSFLLTIFNLPLPKKKLRKKSILENSAKKKLYLICLVKSRFLGAKVLSVLPLRVDDSKALKTVFNPQVI